MTSKIFFSTLTLLLLFFFYFGFKQDFFEKKHRSAPSQFKKNIQKVKSSCREISIEEKNLNTKSKASDKLQRFTNLMNKPIDLVLKDTKGSIIDLYCLRNKKLVLLNFWASWCPPCIQELPSLSKLAEKHHKNIFVVAISTESSDLVKNFISQSFPDLSPQLKVVPMSKEQKRVHFPEDQLPVTYIFNRAGRLKWKEFGAKDWSDQQLVQQILQLP